MWQQVHATLAARDHADNAVLGVATDAQGPERARDYVEWAGVTFPTLLDEAGIMSRLLGFKVVPNGLLLDESGVVRFAKFGGFTIEDGPTRAMVERWLRGGDLDEHSRVDERAPLSGAPSHRDTRGDRDPDPDRAQRHAE